MALYNGVVYLPEEMIVNCILYCHMLSNMCCVYFQSMAVLGGLLYMGCSPSLIDVPLYDCAHLAYLLNWGADPNESDSAEDTPLHIAVRDGETKVAEMLLEHGASTSRVNDVNQTALDTAAAFLRFECLKCIYRHIECQRQ